MTNNYELEEEDKKNSGTPEEKKGRIFKSKNEFSKSNYHKNTQTVNLPKSSFHVQKATKHSLEHMERKSKVTYLLIHDSEINIHKHYEDIEEFKTEATKIYKEKIGQKMQSKSKENLIKETVINIKSDTKLEDIEKTFEALNKNFGGHHVLASSLHFDEGVFIDTKYDIKDLEYTSSTLSWRNVKLDKDVTNEVIDYAPNRNIFYKEENKSWYFDKEFENKADTSKFQKKINYHAHVLYSNFDKDSGKTARMDRSKMRELQTIVADCLGMKRGQEFSKNKRMNHWQLKKSIDAKRDLKINNNKEFAKLKDLQKEMKILREELKNKVGVKREDFAKLEEINNTLKAQIKNKELSVDELDRTLKEKLKTIDYQNELLTNKDNAIKRYKEKDNNKDLTVKGEISKERITVSKGLLKKEEIFIYKTESVEKFIEKSKDKEQELTKQISTLKKDNKFLKEHYKSLDKLENFVIGHFKTTDFDKAIEKIRKNIPKVEVLTNNKFLDKDFER